MKFYFNKINFFIEKIEILLIYWFVGIIIFLSYLFHKFIYDSDVGFTLVDILTSKGKCI